jgi:signal transduction histidine kinase
MRERAARIGAALHISSQPGAGTHIELTVPNRIAVPGIALKE